jgi:protein TonB
VSRKKPSLDLAALARKATRHGGSSFLLHALVVAGIVTLAGVEKKPEPPTMGVKINPICSVQLPPPREEVVVTFEKVEPREKPLEPPPMPMEEISRDRILPEEAPIPEFKQEPPPDMEKPLKPVPERLAVVPAVEAPVPDTVNAPPEYPASSRRRGHEGSVVLSFDVLTSGACANIRVETSSGYSALDASAERAVNHWRFTPAKRLGRLVVHRMQIRFTFRLKG